MSHRPAHYQALAQHGCGGNMKAGLPSSVGVPLAQRLRFSDCSCRIKKGKGKCAKKVVANS